MSVNFHPDLQQLMLEARYLDRQRFAIPPLALQVSCLASTLQPALAATLGWDLRGAALQTSPASKQLSAAGMHMQ